MKNICLISFVIIFALVANCQNEKEKRYDPALCSLGFNSCTESFERCQLDPNPIQNCKLGFDACFERSINCFTEKKDKKGIF